VAVKRKKKKQWIQIVTPKYLGGKELGEILVSQPEDAIGRRIELSAIDVTGDYNKYYMKMFFVVKSVKNSKAYLEFDGSECTRDYIARMVLRRVTRIDSIQDLETKDKTKLRVKSIAVIYGRVTKDIKKKVRKRVSELIEKFVTNSTLEDVVKNVLNDSWKNKIMKECKKLYPLRYFEFRKIEVRRNSQ